MTPLQNILKARPSENLNTLQQTLKEKASLVTDKTKNQHPILSRIISFCAGYFYSPPTIEELRQRLITQVLDKCDPANIQESTEVSSIPNDTASTSEKLQKIKD
jgi:hypothetical protein